MMDDGVDERRDVGVAGNEGKEGEEGRESASEAQALRLFPLLTLHSELPLRLKPSLLT
jgi:hypothetical protein